MRVPWQEILEELIEQNQNGEMLGICLHCGETHEGCELDAQNYKCENCGRNKVFGIEGLMYACE